MSSHSEPIPQWATIRLTIMFDVEAQNLLKSESSSANKFMTEVGAMIQSNFLNSNLGLHVQVVLMTGIKINNIIIRSFDYLEQVKVELIERNINSEFLIVLTGKVFQSPSYHAETGTSLGTACSPDSVAVVLMKQIDTGRRRANHLIARSMTAALLYSLSTSLHPMGCVDGRICCHCNNESCIMDDHPSESLRIPVCSKGIIMESVPYCLKTKPSNRSKIPICGNGLPEVNEKCDCHMEDTKCQTSCAHCVKVEEKTTTVATSAATKAIPNVAKSEKTTTRAPKPIPSTTTIKTVSPSLTTITTDSVTLNVTVIQNEDKTAAEAIAIVSIVVIGVCIVGIPIVIYLLCRKKNKKR